MNHKQLLTEFEALISKRVWYKDLPINRFQASGIKRRYKKGELHFSYIVNLLKEANYKLFALPPVASNDGFKRINYSLSDKQIELLKIIGYFDELKNTPDVNDAIDFIRQRFDVRCAVNLFWDYKDEKVPYKYTYSYLDPFRFNKHHAGGWYLLYKDAAEQLLNELLALNL